MQDILLFLVLPVSTVFLLSSLEKICLEISMNHTIRILLAALFIVISNFIVYIVYDKMLDKTEKINQLQEIAYKENIDYRSYELIKEKYEDLKIMVHNFEKYCNNIEGMIGIQSNEAASFINVLKDKNKEFLLVEYTNNKALNILLSQKQRQCSKEKIDFQLYIQDIDLSFIKEIDIVSIFSNLLDNSIESSRNSENKKIFLSVQMMNNSFVVVRIDNSCDSEPIVYDGIMHTQKRNKEQHGLGIISVKKSLAKYNGNMDWDYDKDNRLFSVILLINCFKQNSDI
jgi:sensor histidine kinase regulating citrate/malate metabolism